LQRNFPVASMLNKAGYYTQPTAANVAIALQGNRIITAPKPQDPLPLLLYVVAAAVAVLGIFAPPALKFALDRRRVPGSPKRLG
jgi:hypothetical protein